MQRIKFIGNGIGRFTLSNGKRQTFLPNVSIEVSSKDAEFLLQQRAKGCGCHNEPPKTLFLLAE